jgi:DNA-binding beta-propeller fold protein YncE
VTIQRVVTALTVTVALLGAAGCTNTPPTQFSVQTNGWIIALNPVTGISYYLQVPLPGIYVHGVLSGYNGPYGGDITNYSGSTSDLISTSLGTYSVSNLELPAYWDHYVEEPSQCTSITNQPGITYEGTDGTLNVFEVPGILTQTDETFEWDCNDPLGGLTVPSSRFALAGSIPSSITIPGQAAFSTTYGMPVLYLFDGLNGNPSLAASVTASSVAANGSSATFPLPASLAADGYGLVTANATSNGTYLPNGINLYAVGSSQSQEGAPFGVAVAAISDAYQDRNTCDRDVTGQTFYDTFPVISLYSQNEVSLDYENIAVGQNPTAVATYTGPTVTQTSSDDCDQYQDRYSGANRAIVTNSGSNTVTLLDLVNEDSLGNVTVGNQPVAVVVSANGDDAYVANYGDSTVTHIALSSGNATTTVSVGGQPTSVALTANGTLWVGGAGFMSEVNTANMTVTATETTSKSIVGLGYSDLVGQIVATSVDSSGNVYADQLNPSNVTPGGTYTPVNSEEISTLGTHLDTRTDEYVKAFTDTLASSATLNVNEPGGPPLVVYDAWVAVTATPTGFTITDIADNYQFASVSTPSPVTAIAVDPYLNVAYLTMPDSNLIWTVPLPGLTSTPGGQ